MRSPNDGRRCSMGAEGGIARSAGDGEAATAGAAAAHPLSAVFAPRSVAVIGASADSTKRGYQSVRTLLEAGYRGRILPVNPRGGTLQGLPVATSLDELGEAPDLALVCTPAASVPGVLEACAARGVGAAVVLALGFAETGEAGQALEESVRTIAARTGLRVVGPNTPGLLRPSTGLNLVGLRDARPGRVGVLVQSGNVLLGLVTELAERFDEGVSIAVGMGNQTVTQAADYLEYLALDPETRAVAMYVEGFRDGRRFVDVARRVAARLPIVLLKGGRTEAGSTAARSHTGALAGEYAVFRAALEDAGVVEVTRADELAAVAIALARQPRERAGRGIAIVSDGGGHATLAADALTDLQAPLARLSAATRQQLSTLLGAVAATANPVDLAGAADRDPPVFAEAVRVVLADEDVGGVLVAGLFGGYAVRFAGELAEIETAAARTMAAAACGAGKPLIVHSLYASRRTEPLAVLRSHDVPVIASLETAARSIAALVAPAPAEAVTAVAPEPDAKVSGLAAATVRAARADGRDTLLETEARLLAAAVGARIVPAIACARPEEAAAAARGFATPVVLKAVSPAAPHKTEAGAVEIGIGPADVAQAWTRIHTNVERWAAAQGRPADIRTILVSPMLPRPLAEVLIGVRRDPSFGPVLAVGTGGVRTELDRDFALRLLPASPRIVRDLLLATRAGALLRGFRGAPAADLDALVRIALAFADLLQICPDIAVIEANPVFAMADDAVAVDVRVTLGTDRK